MDWFVKAFLKASLAWLAAGVSLGLALAVHPAWAAYRTAHLHMNLLGFVAMMIFGVAYHVIPRFTGHPLHNRRLAAVQWWLANGGLVVFVVGLALLPNTMYSVTARVIVAAGGLLSATASYVFVYNIWRTIDGPPNRRSVSRAGAEVAAVTALHRRTAS
jgi:cytochrome c oxidase cbb3-type subunit 1